MNSRKPFVVPALAGIIPCRLKAVQQTAQSIDAISYHAPDWLHTLTDTALENF